MGRIVIVSNRLPVHAVRRGRHLQLQPSVGGLATGLGSLLDSFGEHLWIGWPGLPSESLSDQERARIGERLAHIGCRPVPLTEGQIKSYYAGFSNKTLWPLFHYFIQYTRYDRSLWEAYRAVNRLFSDAVLAAARPDDLIWIHDYHLLLLPAMVRERLPAATIGFFLHIPFPSYEVFRLLPWRREILEGMLGADLVGFHTYDYVSHFLSAVRGRLGCDTSLGRVACGERLIKADSFPMGIDHDRFARAASLPEVRREIEKIRSKVGETKVILSVDRVDYSKGILERLEAYDLFLQRNPHYRGKVTLILVGVPSREGIEHYDRLKRQLHELVGRVSGTYGTLEWHPVWYLHTSLEFAELSALYAVADVALVTPLRDGMNLIAKEFVAAKGDQRGVLVLSELAGAAKELGEALIVNPNNVERIAAAIEKALSMPRDEQIDRNRQMQDRLRRYSVQRWARHFLDELLAVKDRQTALAARRLSPHLRARLAASYREAQRRLLLLDYDGTLRTFEPQPERAVPDGALLELLGHLASDPANDVLLVSGRDRDRLERWFSHLPLGLVAEHGAWIRPRTGTWESLGPLTSDWKREIRPLLETCTDHTPGAYVEEKEFSLVWHYRRSDPEQGALRARELADALMHLTATLALGVLEGEKVIEVRFNVESPRELRQLLRELAQGGITG